MKAFNAGHFFRQSHRQVPAPLAEFTVRAKGARGSASGQKCTRTISLPLSLSCWLARRENRGNNQTRRFPSTSDAPQAAERAPLPEEGEGGGRFVPRGARRDSAERGTKTRARADGEGGKWRDVESQAALFQKQAGFRGPGLFGAAKGQRPPRYRARVARRAAVLRLHNAYLSLSRAFESRGRVPIAAVRRSAIVSSDDRRSLRR